MQFKSDIQAAQQIQQQKRRRENTKEAFYKQLKNPCQSDFSASFGERYVDLEIKNLPPAMAAHLINLMRDYDNEIIHAGEDRYTRRSLRAYAEQIYREFGGR